jgi:hypothetical protein
VPTLGAPEIAFKLGQRDLIWLLGEIESRTHRKQPARGRLPVQRCNRTAPAQITHHTCPDHGSSPPQSSRVREACARPICVSLPRVLNGAHGCRRVAPHLYPGTASRDAPTGMAQDILDRSATPIPPAARNIFARLAIACRAGANIGCDRNKREARVRSRPTRTSARISSRTIGRRR